MPLAPLETLTDYLNLTDFAVEFTYSATDYKGIFDNAYAAIDGGEVDINGIQPVLMCIESDVSGIAYGDTVTIDGTGYKVTSTRPDGTGMIELFLELA